MLLVLIIAGVEMVRSLVRRRISGIARLLGRGMGIIWGRPRHDGRVCRKSGGEDLKDISRDDGGFARIVSRRNRKESRSKLVTHGKTDRYERF